MAMALSISSITSSFTSLSVKPNPRPAFISFAPSRRLVVVACDNSITEDFVIEESKQDDYIGNRPITEILAEAAETAAGITSTVDNLPAGWTVEQYMRYRLPGGIAAQEILATGKKKCAIARVALQDGDGKVMVNYRDAKDYFRGNPEWLEYLTLPLKWLGLEKRYDILVKAHGGGLSGQAQAICLGVSRALLKLDGENKQALKEHKLLSRDPRVVERKKAGRKKARKSPQFSKR